MAKLEKVVEKARKNWEAMPRETRDKILQRITVAHKAMRDVYDLSTKCFLDSVVELFKVGAQAVLMPFGPGIEGVVVEVAHAIPELSAYVRQLMGD